MLLQVCQQSLHLLIPSLVDQSQEILQLFPSYLKLLFEIAVKLVHGHMGMLIPFLHEYIEPRLFIQHESGIAIMGMRIIEVD